MQNSTSVKTKYRIVIVVNGISDELCSCVMPTVLYRGQRVGMSNREE